ESIVIATNKGEPCVMDESSFAGRAFRDICRRVNGETVPLMDLDIDQGILAKIKKFFFRA
ncbi:MAG: septum site-determining protein MinD, partial [Defluviitaleaceae bacterium]|nr:septum site-determining protein MinD [Defluviitaleaceae bacterium]